MVHTTIIALTVVALIISVALTIFLLSSLGMSMVGAVGLLYYGLLSIVIAFILYKVIVINEISTTALVWLVVFFVATIVTPIFYVASQDRISGNKFKEFSQRKYEILVAENQVKFNGIAIAGADAKSFVVHDNEEGEPTQSLASDAHNIYFDGTIMSDIDRGSFRLLNNEFFVDKHSVYYFKRSMDVRRELARTTYLDSTLTKIKTVPSNLDLQTLTHIAIPKDHPEAETGEVFYAKDKNNVYFVDTNFNNIRRGIVSADSLRLITIEGADPDTFAIMNLPLYIAFTKDKNHVYLQGELLTDISPKAHIMELGFYVYSVDDELYSFKNLETDGSKWAFNKLNVKTSEATLCKASTLADYFKTEKGFYYHGEYLGNKSQVPDFHKEAIEKECGW